MTAHLYKRKFKEYFGSDTRTSMQYKNKIHSLFHVLEKRMAQ